MDSQVASKHDAKPNMAILPKLRWGVVRTDAGEGRSARTLTTCSMLSVCISRRSKAVPVHLGSSIVMDEGREFGDGGG